LLKAKLRLREAKLDLNLGAMPSVSPFNMHNLVREAGVTLSAFTRSFISDAELCCEHIGQPAALLWVDASRCPLLPLTGAFAPCPRRLFARLPPLSPG
jgi:hypothetical protein